MVCKFFSHLLGDIALPTKGQTQVPLDDCEFVVGRGPGLEQGTVLLHEHRQVFLAFVFGVA
jgi:hypothetical protein